MEIYNVPCTYCSTLILCIIYTRTSPKIRHLPNECLDLKNMIKYFEFTMTANM